MTVAAERPLACRAELPEGVAALATDKRTGEAPAYSARFGATEVVISVKPGAQGCRPCA